MIDRAAILYRLRLRREAAAFEERLHALESDDALRLMLASHVAFLDHLTRESGGSVNYRTEFTSWYLTHRPIGPTNS